MELSDIIERFRRGERVALSRAISLAERQSADFPALFDALFEPQSETVRIGFTGPPGAGKSTLVSAFVKELRKEDERVAVLAVDPSSPFTGGAVLGDRVRMNEHTMDPEVFIRSMATRGSLGGLARQSIEAADLLAAFGYPWVLIETVGVGQSEYDVMEAADLVFVILHPGAGDSVQAMKAGLLELADVFVINKADMPGVERLQQELDEMMHMRLSQDRQEIPVVLTTATKGAGVQELVETSRSQLDSLRASGALEERRRRRIAGQLRRIVEASLREQLMQDADAELASDARDPATTGKLYAAAEQMLARLRNGTDPS